MSDYGERLKALRKAKYPDFSEDMDMHDITDGMSWMADRIEELEAKLEMVIKKLMKLEESASVVSKYGATTGNQWLNMSLDILDAITTLAELTGGKDE